MFDIVLIFLTGVFAGAFALYSWAVWNQKRTIDQDAVNQRIEDLEGGEDVQ